MTTKAEITNAGGSVQYLNNLPNSPAPAAYYSQLVWAGDTAYLAGQIPLDPATGKLVEGGIAAQTERTIDNVEAVLAGAGLSLADVAKVSVYLTDMSDAPTMNEIYIRRFGTARPARELLAVKGLALGANIELTVVAYRGNNK